MKASKSMNYELIDGKAIVDNNYAVVSANEEFYRFVGISRKYTLVDYIHQVDMEDFIEVTNSLRLDVKKSMVLRMKRVDNSYRWIIADITKKELLRRNGDGSIRDNYEYIEMELNDIQSLQNRNKYLEAMMNNYSNLLSLAGEIIFNVDLESEYISFYRFIDNELTLINKMTIDELYKEYDTNNVVYSNDKLIFEALFSDIMNCRDRFSYSLRIKDIDNIENKNYHMVEIKGKAAEFEEGKVKRIDGTIKNLESSKGFSQDFIVGRNENYVLSKGEVLKFFKENMEYNPNVELMFMIFKIDKIDYIKENYGAEFTSKLIKSVFGAIKSQVSYRGVVGMDAQGNFYIVAKGLNREVSARAFLEAVRSMINWNYKILNDTYDVTFSIGVSRYPFNGKIYEKNVLKAQKALEIADKKGGNCYVLYKETLHGDV